MNRSAEIRLCVLCCRVLVRIESSCTPFSILSCLKSRSIWFYCSPLKPSIEAGAMETKWEIEREGSRNYSLTLFKSIFYTRYLFIYIYYFISVQCSFWFDFSSVALLSALPFYFLQFFVFSTLSKHTQTYKKTILKFTIALSTIYYLALLFLRLFFSALSTEFRILQKIKFATGIVHMCFLAKEIRVRNSYVK